MCNRQSGSRRTWRSLSNPDGNGSTALAETFRARGAMSPCSRRLQATIASRGWELRQNPNPEFLAPHPLVVPFNVRKGECYHNGHAQEIWPRRCRLLGKASTRLDNSRGLLTSRQTTAVGRPTSYRSQAACPKRARIETPVRGGSSSLPEAAVLGSAGRTSVVALQVPGQLRGQ